MYMKQEVQVKGVPVSKAPYSQGILADKFAFIAGQGPTDPHTGKAPDGIEAQTRAVIKKIEALLEASGSDMEHIVKTTVFLSDLSDYSGMNKVYQELIPSPYPSRSTVGAQLLGGILVEIEVIALIKQW